jgi:TfoX/Sxy family transcriptional regulator of competence genes
LRKRSDALACDEQLVERIRAALKGTRGAGERRMFGGVCFTIEGNMVCGVVKNDLMVRVGPDKYEDALKQPHARPMDFTGRPMNGYVFVAPPGVKSESSLKDWVGAGVAHVRTLPPKSPKSKRR